VFIAMPASYSKNLYVKVLENTLNGSTTINILYVDVAISRQTNEPRVIFEENSGLKVVERIRQKGATSPDKAITIEELGLPPRFKEAMERRLGRSGVFVEVNGKYYLSEEKLKEIREQLALRRGFRGR